MAEGAKSTRLVYVLPWLRLSTGQYGVHRVPIGPATFAPDDDPTWAKVVGKPRPMALDVFRTFPDDEEDQEPVVARGTVLVADDERWLQEYVHLLVPLLYVLGQPHDRWQTPAERFRYFGYRVSGTPSDSLSFLTKKGELWEDRRSLKLYPPLELRGAHRPYRVDVHEPRNRAFVRRFEANPNDRLVVAASHLFRTQFADPFSSPWDQDYASYCTCLEAALDIGDDDQAPEGSAEGATPDGAGDAGGLPGDAAGKKAKGETLRDIGKSLAKRLAEKYLDLKDMPDWIEGLYACRVIFIHGLSGDATMRERQKKLRDAFLARRGNHSILRNFCVDIIREQLQTTDNEMERLIRQLMGSRGIYNLLESFFNSDRLWQALRDHLGGDKAADKVRAYNEGERGDFLRACLRYVHDHCWEYMRSAPADDHVFRVLISLALLIAKSGKASGDEIKAVDALGQAADRKDRQAVAAWARQHRAWKKEFDGSDWLKVYKAVMAHTARCFDAAW